MRVAWLIAVGAVVLSLTGCARGGGTGPGIPNWVVEFIVRFAGPIDDTSFYFVAIDADGDFGVDGPLPVAAGPYWGNGWGAGSITHFVSYTQGRYDVYAANRQLELETQGGGIVGATGSPQETATGEYQLTVGNITLGAATLGGAGAITGVTNDSDQNAGQFSLETDASGQTVAGGTSFAPAADGGRAPNTAEQAALDALNAGAALAPDSLAAFGLTLQIGAPAAGTQTIDVAPTVAQVAVKFQSASGGTSSSTGTVTANSTTPTPTPPIPGVSLRTGTLQSGGVARFRSETAPTSTLIGPPYESVAPMGGSQLDVTVDLNTLGQNLDNLSVNFISTTELIFDPTVNSANLHCYDGLSNSRADAGNAYVTFSVRQTRTISNGDFSAPETGGDVTVNKPLVATQAEQDSIDIIDWSITIQRLSG